MAPAAFEVGARLRLRKTEELLALLEGQELLSSTFRGAALLGFGMVLAAGAWFAAATCLVLLATPDASLVVRFAVFALLNAAGAVGLVALAMRRRRKGKQS